MNERLLERYVSKGWYLLPCKPGSKVPATRNGVYGASNDLGKLVEVLRKYPNLNWAVANGASRLFVIDVDSKGGGLEVLTPIEQAYTRLTRTPLVAYTPNGGWHFYFRMQVDLPCTVGRIAKGVDTRGVGGYTMLAPSTIENSAYGEYLWLDEADLDVELPPVPQWLVDMLTKPAVETDAIRVEDLEGSAQRIADWLYSAPEGERNNRLFWAACEYRRIGVGLTQAQNALGSVAKHIGLPEREAAKTIASAYKR